MSALRFFATGRPSLIGAPVQTMSKLDAEFWRIRAERQTLKQHRDRAECKAAAQDAPAPPHPQPL